MAFDWKFRALGDAVKARDIKLGDRFAREAGGSVVEPGTSAGPIRMRLSDDSVDRYGTILRQDGWRLDNYRKSPVVLWSHNSWEPAIGRGENLEVVDGALMGEAVFARDVNPMARLVEDLIRGKFLHAVSVGWQTLKWSFDEEQEQLYFDEMELLEFSPVNVPGNANALVEGRAAGIDIAPAIEQAEALLRAARGAGKWVEQAELEQLLRKLDSREPPRVFTFGRSVGSTRLELGAPTAEGLEMLVLKLGKRDDGEDEPGATPCPECDAEMPGKAKFCSECGAKMTETAPAEEPAASEAALDPELVKSMAREAVAKALA